MSLLGAVRALRADVARHTNAQFSRGQKVAAVLGTQGIWAAAVYRYGRWVYEAPRGALGVPLKVSYKVSHKVIEVTTGISLPAAGNVGDGLYIGHFGQIIIHAEVEAGQRLSIGQGVTLGTRGLGKAGAPKIGDDVYIGVGAKVLGDITIGDGARIGAGAVVLRDVAAHTTVVGVPAREVRSAASKEEG